MAAVRPLNVLLTGGNTGIGRATAETLVRHGHNVWVASRSREKTLPVLEEIRASVNGNGSGSGNPIGRIDYLPLDLGDLSSVRQCADAFLALGEPLHVLLANAGLAGHQGTTKDGFEIQFGTNHLGHFLLTKKLLPLLEQSAPARVVVVASRANYRVKKIDWDALRKPTKSPSGFPEYAVSKLCNVLFAKELARRVGASSNISTYALHPGVVASDIWRRIPWPFRWFVTRRLITNEEGARTSVYCATDPVVADKTARYWDDCAEKEPNPLANDETLARTLWEKSETWSSA